MFLLQLTRWEWHAAYMGKQEMYTKFLLGKLKVRDQLGDLGVYGRIILK
jgi:hypothetical protein